MCACMQVCLVLGCGVGGTAAALAEAFPRVLAIDTSQRCIDAAKVGVSPLECLVVTDIFLRLPNKMRRMGRRCCQGKADGPDSLQMHEDAGARTPRLSAAFVERSCRRACADMPSARSAPRAPADGGACCQRRRCRSSRACHTGALQRAARSATDAWRSSVPTSTRPA